MNNKVYDVSKYASEHPGGKILFIVYLKKLILGFDIFK